MKTSVRKSKLKPTYTPEKWIKGWEKANVILLGEELKKRYKGAPHT
tara:strand:+ start:352 stop:489 length:138 start_codon:yes stop_codon:yes gene_type:complete